jgi:hypothetical protein
MSNGPANAASPPLRRRGGRHPALSEVLAHIAADESRERVSVRDALDLAGDRAFGALLFVFALPNVIPMPPGTSTILGLPLVLLAGQFLFGRKTPWLPRMVTNRSVARADFASVLARISPHLRRLERVLRPRFGLLVSPVAERLIGLVMVALSLLIFFPIPFGNIVPAAAICLMSLALVEHDGLMAAVGAVIGILAVVFVWGAVLAVLRTALAAIEHFGLFGA